MDTEFRLFRNAEQAKKSKRYIDFSEIFPKKETAIDAVPIKHSKQSQGVVDYIELFQSRDERKGTAYYKDGDKKPSFTAMKSNDLIKVHQLNENSIRAGLQLAQKEFGSVFVDGTKDVCRKVWLEGQAIGIEVQGFEPTDKDLAAAKALRQELVRKTPAAEQRGSQTNNAANSSIAAASAAAPEPPAKPSQPDVLVNHGVAPFEFIDKNKNSYFVAVRDDAGEVKVHWGVDLERAIDEAAAEPGDQVHIERKGFKFVEIIDEETKKPREVKRQNWQVDVIEKANTIIRLNTIAAAQELIGVDAQLYQANKNNGMSSGSIIHINDSYVVQQTGDKSAIIHELAQLSKSVSVGQDVKVSYQDGQGSVESSVKNNAEIDPKQYFAIIKSALEDQIPEQESGEEYER